MYEVVTEEGEIAGARFIVAGRKGLWNNRLLLLAHGYRPESAPLAVDPFTHRAACATLLHEGWIVASTSFRRNGVILADAMADLDALRSHVSDTHGEPSLTLLAGESMGGAIVALLAERGATPYSGAIGIGASLETQEPGGAVGLSLEPRIPLLFLANRSEFEAPKSYVIRATAMARASDRHDVVPPALFRIARDGHASVSQAERLAAVRAMVKWIQDGRPSLPKAATSQANLGATVNADEFHDATIPTPDRPSRVVFGEDGRSFTAKVTESDPFHGNLLLDAQPADLERMGLSLGAYFQAQTPAGKTFRVRYGRDFDAVERGRYVMVADAEGILILARHLASAAAAESLGPGDAIQIRRYP